MIKYYVTSFLKANVPENIDLLGVPYIRRGHVQIHTVVQFIETDNINFSIVGNGTESERQDKSNIWLNQTYKKFISITSNLKPLKK